MAINHKEPDRVPVDLRFAEELKETIKKTLGMEEEALWNWLGQDIYTIRPVYKNPASPIKYADPTIAIDEQGNYIDIYHVPFKMISNAYQSYLESAGLPPLANCDSIEGLKEFPWPSADDWDYSGIETNIERISDRGVWCRSRGCFQTAQLMRGAEQFLMDLLLQPEYADFLLDKIMEFVMDDAKRSLEAANGKYTFIEYNDDIATQRGLLISPSLWREMVKPRMAKFCRMAKSFGVKVKYHCCGSVYDVIEDLIEIGVDILNPIQPLAKNMNPYDIKREFGNRLCLHGGVEIQELLPYGSPERVKEEVIKMITGLGKDGGYILAGSHTIQADTPVRNIVAIVDAFKEVYDENVS
jgi:uroporphyrinogen decarboxylase